MVTNVSAGGFCMECHNSRNRLRHQHDGKSIL